MIDSMTPHQRIFAIAVAALLMLLVVELVRRRRLREEYSWLWLLAGTCILVLVVWQGALTSLTSAIGAQTHTTAVFALGILFLMVVCIHLCTKLSQVDRQLTELAQELALLRAELPETPAPAAPRGDS